MIKLGVLFGGRSGEHEVSLASGAAVIRAVDKSKYEVVPIGITRKGEWLLYEGSVEKIEYGNWEKKGKPFDISKLKEMIDFAFPVLHGTNGEDGKLQGLFEMMDIPYAGCGVLSSAINMDKGFTKDIFMQYGIPTARYELAANGNEEEIAEKLGFPIFVKPANAGSSVGVSKAKNIEELRGAIAKARKYDDRVVCEEAIDAREIETGVIGNDKPIAAEVGEIVIAADFYDYDAKYTDDAGTTLQIPAKISQDTAAEIKALAIKAYTALDCKGFARVDFFLDRKTGKLLVNELNTIPGFTRYSMFPLLWKKAGLGFAELIDRIIELGYERYNDKNNR